MLVAQAAYAAEYFSGRTFSDEDIERVYKKVLAETSNIVLIGMPGTGKSVVGRALAERLNFTFVDVDDLIRKAQGALSQLGWPENNDD